MISSINVAELRAQRTSMAQKQNALPKTMSATGNYTSFSNAACEALKSQISFKGFSPIEGINLDKVEGKDSINAVLNGENRIANSFAYAQGDYQIISRTEDDIRLISISKNSKPIIEGYIKDALDEDTKIEFNVAKHNPEIKITTGDSTIQLFEGSSIKDRNDLFKFTFPGKTSSYDYQNNTSAKRNIAFTGIYSSLLCKKPATVEAVTYEKPAPFVGSGVHWQTMAEDDPSVVTLMGGFGTRFANLTAKDSNKPSFIMPNGQSLAGAALDLAKNSMGLRDGIKNVTYLNQGDKTNPRYTGRLQYGDKIVDSKAFSSDGGAVINAVLNGHIPTNKPLVILNADTITNVDISDSYKRLKELNNAALVIPCYPVSETRAKSFGLMAAGSLADEDGSRELTSFVEKPANPSIEAADAMIKGEQVNGEQAYRGNPGIYLFNETVLQNIDLVLERAKEIALEKKQAQARKSGKPIPEDLGKDEFSAATFLGNAFVPAVVRLCQEEKLIGADGRPMKTYIVPMVTSTGKQAIWDDVGSAEALIKNVQDIAYETYKVGDGPKNKYFGIRNLADFRESVHLETGVVYASPEDRRAFENKYAHEFEIKGNAYVKCS
ncbi:MAG: hypothetical protein IJW73_06990 [Candidatus Gastranaerophilales bacterium]|nr:hypothetical protein [Candidatus Gastranaerophilales bacterium]